MKKFVSFIAVFMLTICVGLGESTSFNPEEYSDDDLLTIVNSIEEELISRGIIRELEEGEVEITNGEYVVGEDLPSGRYLISILGGGSVAYTVEKYKGAEDDYLNKLVSSTNEYPSPSDYYEMDIIITEKDIRLDEGNILKIQILEDNALQKVTIKKSTGLFMDE